MDLKTLLLLFASFGVQPAEQKLLPESPVDGMLGKNLTLRPLLGNQGYDFMLWNYSNGTGMVSVATSSGNKAKVTEPYMNRFSINSTSGALTLRDLRREDSGDYSISVVFPNQESVSDEVKVRVLEPVSDVVVTSDVPEAVEFNSTVVLTCRAKGSFLKFTWLNDTAPVEADGRRVSVKEEDVSSELTIYEVLRSDLKRPVVCVAANKLETEKSAPFKLTVYYGPDDVQIQPAEPPRYVRAGSGFNLTCSSVSSPPASYLWFHNQEQVKNQGPVLPLDAIEKLGYGKKEGSYSCGATNAKTKRVVRSSPVTFSVMEPVSGTELTGPTSVLIAGNSSANLSCVSTAGVVKTRTWLKDGKPLRTNGVVFSADKSSVLIYPLLKEDNGKFTCQLANPVNSEDATYDMVVNYGPEMPTVSGRSAVEVEDSVTLTCSASSRPPATFTWKFNGTLTAVKTATYTVDKARYSHSGTYACEAHNAVTGKKASQTFTLSVKEELEGGLSDGAIAGIVIGVLVALAAAIALVFYCRQKLPVDSPY